MECRECDFGCKKSYVYGWGHGDVWSGNWGFVGTATTQAYEYVWVTRMDGRLIGVARTGCRGNYGC